MDIPGPRTDLDDFHLDILGQRPRINRLYTQLTFCFHIPNDSPSLQSDIISSLNRGIEQLSAAFPWVAGKVVNESSILKIKPADKPLGLVVRDLRHDRSNFTWEVLQQANFPFSMLDESIIAPCKTLIVSNELALDLPVFLVQANFVAGGLLLTFNAQHGSMDMTGQGQVIYFLAKACRNEPFTQSEMSVGNMNRKNIIPLLDDSSSGVELDHQVSKSPPSKAGQPTNAQSLPPFETSGKAGHAAHPPAQSQPQPKPQSLPPKLVWSYFAFSATSLAALKSLVVETALGKPVSTDDCLTAFVWQCISRARVPRLRPHSELNSTLSRAVDVRRALNIPSTYPGLISNATFSTIPVTSVAKQPLGSIARILRHALEPGTLSESTRALATSISRHEDADKVGFANTSVPELDVRLSSWAKENCYDLDFGFGRPVAVRRPRFGDGSREGLVYFLPKRLDGEIVVGICLRDEDLERLKGDEEFTKFGTYIG